MGQGCGLPVSYGVARQRAGRAKTSFGGLGRAFSPAFRAGSLYPLGRVGAEEFGAAKNGFSRRDAA